MAEGNLGTTNATFTVRRTDSTNAGSVNFSAGNGTGANSATAADQDFLPSTGSTVSFDPADWNDTTKVAEKIISLKMVGDSKVEQDEHFYVTLTMAQNATIIPTANRATAVIRNDD